ncbi:retinol dehydrogenase 11-like [Portunus trituberculatus]|uniref:retinol dehydrogenase 11-like n=1 Tax=Portunus trituberculatus TaxID=210409 RepID=UPI001E1CEF42|nr:retinol dehydrogenase 11-like [Portunus trituberculatus]XP_045114028.1 retinol dehydrogenase 11-like [Portunus trituberculatus]
MWKMITVVLTYLASALRIVADAAILLLKRRLKLYRPVQCCCQNRVRGKVVIVTGASSGIGFAIAHDLASKGAHVYLAGRNIKTGQDAVLKLHKKTGNPAIHFLYLDLQDFCSIHAFVKSFLKCENQLNALVNNAAVFHHPSGLTTDQIEITYQTNYLGVFLLTNLLQSVLKQSSNPRIVFVTSEAHKLVSVQDLVAFKPRQLSSLTTFSDYVKIYGLSKLALHLYSQHLVESLPGVYVGLADPGNVWTPIYRRSWRSWSLKHMLVRLQCYIFMRDAQEGAQSTIHFLNTPNPRSGQYINSFMVGEEKQPYDSSLVKRLVADSVFLTGLPRSSLPQAAVVTGVDGS